MEIQRILNSVEEQVYATWKTYNIITDMGTKLDNLKISNIKVAAWMSGPGYAPTRKNFASLYYTIDGTTLSQDGYANGGYKAQHAYGARPALYD